MRAVRARYCRACVGSVILKVVMKAHVYNKGTICALAATSYSPLAGLQGGIVQATQKVHALDQQRIDHQGIQSAWSNEQHGGRHHVAHGYARNEPFRPMAGHDTRDSEGASAVSGWCRKALAPSPRGGFCDRAGRLG